MIQSQNLVKLWITNKETAKTIEKYSSVDSQFRCEYARAKASSQKQAGPVRR